MFRIYAHNASGDTLFFVADADGADYVKDVTSTEAYSIMATRKSGHRWNDDTQRFTRNKIAYFRLVHATGHAERVTPAEALAVVNAPTTPGRVLAETVAHNLIAAAIEINAGSPFLATEPAPAAVVSIPRIDPGTGQIVPQALDCFGRPALSVLVGATIMTVHGVDEFGAIHVRECNVGNPVPATVTGIINPGALPTLDSAVYESKLWAFARKPKPLAEPAPSPFNPAGAAQTAQIVATAASIASGNAAALAPLAELAAAAVAANDGLPLNVLPMAQGLAALEQIAAEQERREARIANVMGDWKGKEIVLPTGRTATVGEHRHGTVRLIRTTGPNAGDSAWYPAEDIWQGLENGTILTPDQITSSLEPKTLANFATARVANDKVIREAIAAEPAVKLTELQESGLRYFAKGNRLGGPIYSGGTVNALERRRLVERTPNGVIVTDAGRAWIAAHPLPAPIGAEYLTEGPCPNPSGRCNHWPQHSA